jgi:hypothetical protein
VASCPRTPPLAVIAEAVRRVAAGAPILSPRITRRLMDRVAAEAGTYHRARAALATLSAREHQVAVAVAQGKTNAEIARAATPERGDRDGPPHPHPDFELGNRTQIALLIHDAGLSTAAPVSAW